MSTPPDIFLSYSREDQARAKLFAEAFEREGFKVWWDVGLRTGEAYDEVTENALRSAKAVVVLWSKRSVTSRWVRAEATLADRNKTLVPAMIEACERPIMFELTQTAELAHWKGDADDSGWCSFLSDVRRFVDRRAGNAQAQAGAAVTMASLGVGDGAALEARRLATIVAAEPVQAPRRASDGAVAVQIEVEAVVARFGGRVFSSTADCFLLEFATPHAAVEAAMALAERKAAVLRIGVHLGDVTQKPDGNLVGHGVDAAMRLMAICAPGSVMVSGAARYLVRGSIVERLVSQGVLELDGMSETMEAFALRVSRPPVSPSDVSQGPPGTSVSADARSGAEQRTLLPHVGRGRELERLRERIERAKRCDGGLLLVSGEAGVGKTRLTQEAERMAKAGGFLVTRGHCHDTDTPPPYQPLLEQIEQVRRMLGSDLMRLSMGPNATELSRLMPELRQQYRDIPPYPNLPPEQERRYLLHGIAEFFARGAAYNPLLVVFEDLHWADESTCILLRHLAERMKSEPVLLIGTYRDGEIEAGRPFSRALHALTRERLSEDIKLGRLSRRETAELVETRVGVRPPPSFVELVHAETDGNPFFVEEMLGLLRDGDRLFSADGTFRSDVKLPDAEVARGIRLVIEERIGKASRLCQEILTLAAVMGRVFPFDLLVRTEAKHSEDEILGAIEEAEEKRLIEDVSQGRIARYQFVHEQLRQTLLSGLSRPRRQRLHLRVADALEASQGGSADRLAGEIGHHLYLAGSVADHARTARFLAIAGERAIDALAFEDALRQFDLALGVLEESDDALTRARLHGLRAMALHGAERIPESLAALKIAVLTAPTRPTKDEFTLQRCEMLLELWRGSEALGDLEGLLVRAREAADARRELRVQNALARAYYVMSLDREGFADKSREAYEGAIRLARAQGERGMLGRSLVATATLVDYWPGDFGLFMANVEEAAVIARELDDVGLGIDVDTARLSFVLQGGPMPDDEEILERALLLRDPARLNAQYFRMMWSTLRSGRLHRCLELCDAGIALAYRIGAMPVQYPTIKALALIELGRFGEAWEALGKEIADEAHRFGAAMRDYGKVFYFLLCGDVEQALVMASHVIDEAKVLARVWMLRMLAQRLALVAADGASTDGFFERVQSLIARTGSSPDSTAAAALELAKGDVGAARDRLSGIGPQDVQRMPPVMQIHVGVLRARLDLAAGDPGAAVLALRGAIAVAREKGMRSRLWRLLAEEARVAEQLGDAASAQGLLGEARSILWEIGQTIPDESQRSVLLSGMEAQRLGLAARQAEEK